MEQTLCELNDILWNVEAMKDLAGCLKLTGVDAEALSRDELMLLFETSLEALAGRIHTLADRVEQASMEEN